MSEPVPIRHLPLSHDVLGSFAAIHQVPSREPVSDPMATRLTVCRMPDARYVLAEISGSVSAVVGQPIATSEAVEIAEAVLANPDKHATGSVAHALAVALLGVLMDTFITRISPLQPLPRARRAS